jgi:tRNA (cytidine/uridine-2'-O-)-methyltransferase
MLPIRLALYQPDIAQNCGTLLRLAACFGVPVDVIEPCGFVWSDRHLKRAGMDYLDVVDVARHDSWDAFHKTNRGRLLLLTTKGDQRYERFGYEAGDTLILGRESAGVPPEVHEAAAARLRIPMRPGLRSLNVALAGAIALAEALRQTGRLPAEKASA